MVALCFAEKTRLCTHYVCCYVFHTVIDVSAQGTCTVTPLNPITLTAAGGVLVDGTENVMIQCNCSDDVGAVLQPIRWFDLKGNIILTTAHRRYVTGTPYFDKRPDDTNVVLVIPTFNDSYDGTYTCGVGNDYPPGALNATVNLTIGGKWTVFCE